jgi:hypothetical protein
LSRKTRFQPPLKPGETRCRNGHRDTWRAGLVAGDTGGLATHRADQDSGRRHDGRRDAFISSFARYLAGGLALDAALVEATRYSAFSVTRHGAQKSFATEAEFAEFGASRN